VREKRRVSCAERAADSPVDIALWLRVYRLLPNSGHRFPAPSSRKEGCRKPVLEVWRVQWSLEPPLVRLKSLQLLFAATATIPELQRAALIHTAPNPQFRLTRRRFTTRYFVLAATEQEAVL